MKKYLSLLAVLLFLLAALPAQAEIRAEFGITPGLTAGETQLMLTVDGVPVTPENVCLWTFVTSPEEGISYDRQYTYPDTYVTVWLTKLAPETVLSAAKNYALSCEYAPAEAEDACDITVNGQALSAIGGEAKVEGGRLYLATVCGLLPEIGEAAPAETPASAASPVTYVLYAGAALLGMWLIILVFPVLILPKVSKHVKLGKLDAEDAAAEKPQETEAPSAECSGKTKESVPSQEDFSGKK